MIDHVSLGVRDLERAARFYEVVLGAIGFAKLVVQPATVGFGKRYSEFWLNLRTARAAADAQSGTHVCLRARSTQEVDAFHAAALAAGGTSDGEPGFRPDYHASYYAAFIRDLDGHRIEAVTFVKTSEAS